MLAGLGIKTTLVIFTILAGVSCIFLLFRAGEILSSGIKEQKLTLRNNNYPEKNIRDISSNRQEISLLFKFKKHLKEVKEIVFESNMGHLWGVSVLLYATTGILTANYADYSSGFLTKPELGLAAMFSSLVAGRAKVSSKSIVRVGIILASTGIFLSIKMPVLAFTLIGAGGGIAVVGMITAVSKINSSGFAMGFFNTGIYAGLGLGPIIGSLFMESSGYESVFLGSGLLLLTTLFVKFE
jgi:hypothetical protein